MHGVFSIEASKPDRIGPGEALELVREPANRSNDHAVAYCHRGVHLDYVPKRQRWIPEALDDRRKEGTRTIPIELVGKGGQPDSDNDSQRALEQDIRTICAVPPAQDVFLALG
jgi:hypothetical protein